MIFYNKGTRNEDGDFFGVRTVEKPDSWDNGKNNFTNHPPTGLCVDGHVECDWNEVTQSWDVDAGSNQSYENKQSAIQAFISSEFNNITIEAVTEYLSYENWTSIATSKGTFLKLVEFTIGLREVLRELISHEK